MMLGLTQSDAEWRIRSNKRRFSVTDPDPFLNPDFCDRHYLLVCQNVWKKLIS